MVSIGVGKCFFAQKQINYIVKVLNEYNGTSVDLNLFIKFVNCN